MDVIRHDDEIGCRERRVEAVGGAPCRCHRLARGEQDHRGIGIDARKHLRPPFHAKGDEEELPPESH